MSAYDHVWRLRRCRPDRKGARCRVLARGEKGGPHNLLVEFEDGERIVTERYGAVPMKPSQMAQMELF